MSLVTSFDETGASSICRETKRQRFEDTTMFSEEVHIQHHDRAIGRIPSEIWSAIFRECLPNETFITPSIHNAPLLLCLVCHLWRQIAHHTPQLWASLKITYETAITHPNNINSGWTISLRPKPQHVRLWLLRAKSTPLSIKYARSADWALTDGPPDFPGILDAIFSVMANWRTVYLTVPTVREQELYAMMLSGAPLLETFLLDTGNPIEDLPGGPPQVVSKLLWNIAASSNALKSFSVKGTSAFINSSIALNFHQGYSQLSILDLGSQISAKDAISLLQSASNVEYCSMSCVSEPRASGLVERVFLPSLRDLRLQGILIDDTWCGSFESILDNITTPALSNLYLVRVDVWPQKTLLALIQRSQCYIQSLSLLSADVHSVPRSQDPEELIQLFAAIPAVEYLWLDIQRPTFTMGMTPREVSALGLWDATNCCFVYCPRLRVIAFTCKQANTFGHAFLEACAGMIEARWNIPGAARTLRRLIIDRQNIVDDANNLVPDSHPHIARMLEIQRKGLLVETDRFTEFDDANVLQYDESRAGLRWRY